METKNFNIRRIIYIDDMHIGREKRSEREAREFKKCMLDSDLYAVYGKEGEPKYTIEINEKRVVQCRASLNEMPDQKDIPEIKKGLIENDLIVDGSNNNFN
jgi:hypothetical protein